MECAYSYFLQGFPLLNNDYAAENKPTINY